MLFMKYHNLVCIKSNQEISKGLNRKKTIVSAMTKAMNQINWRERWIYLSKLYTVFVIVTVTVSVLCSRFTIGFNRLVQSRQFS